MSLPSPHPGGASKRLSSTELGIYTSYFVNVLVTHIIIPENNVSVSSNTLAFRQNANQNVSYIIENKIMRPVVADLATIRLLRAPIILFAFAYSL